MAVAPTKGKKAPKLPEDELHYPSGDGKPMAENDPCREQAIYCTDALSHRYALDPLVYVAGNNFIYYQENQPKKVVSPDVYVVFGVEKRRRRSYMVWKEGGIVPSVVIEITSGSTWAEDTKKRPLYEQLGVAEYFQFDPSADYLYPHLQGLRLVEGYYQAIAPETPVLQAAPNRASRIYLQTPSLCLRSEPLGLYLVAQGDSMRFYDVATGEPLLSGREQAAVEAQARAEAEAEVARLRAELEELRRQQGQ